MIAFTGGASLLLGALLVLAGVMKIVRPDGFRLAVRRVLPQQFDRLSLVPVLTRYFGWFEVVLGAALVSAPVTIRPVAIGGQATAVIVYLAFVWVVRRAIRVGSACGCFSSLSDGRSGGAELGRAIALAVISVAALAAGLQSGQPVGWGWAVLGWSGLLVVLVAFSAVLGAGVSRASSKATAITVSGPFGRRLATNALFLVGRVSTWRLFTNPPIPAKLEPAELEAVLHALVDSPGGGPPLEEMLRDGLGEVDLRELKMGVDIMPNVRFLVVSHSDGGSPVTEVVALIAEPGGPHAIVT
jgi:hypothetical protein